MRVGETALAGEVARSLERLNISFMLVGAAALATRGLTRGTHDIDFMTTDRSVFDLDWVAQLSAGTQVDLRKGDVDDPLAGVVRFSRSGAADVDLVVARWKWQQAVITRSELCDVMGFRAPVPSVADLVLLKLEAGSFLDQRDAAQLIEIHGDDTIREVESCIADLPERLRDAWDALRRELELRSGDPS